MGLGLDEQGNPVSEPLLSVDEVLKWRPLPFCSKSRCPLREREDKDSNRPQTLICHDMDGGYLDDRFCQGGDRPLKSYRFWHWQCVDIFVYFSHRFVTIPPPVWITAAHKHGVTVLGTIITEWDAGAQLCAQFLETEEIIEEITSKLVDIADFYGFEGWLVNIENKIDAQKIPMLQKFVQLLHKKSHDKLKHAKVLWYDSVIDSGELIWQDQLNSNNLIFFNACDGIFLNYLITDEKLVSSKLTAAQQNRQYDVFAGIDVFGRCTASGGGFNCRETIAMIQKYELSYAIFAPGWVMEVLGTEDFTRNEDIFWGILEDQLYQHATPLPFSTNFCQGFGTGVTHTSEDNATSCKGCSIKSCRKPFEWYNLSLQQIQPTYGSSQFQSYTVKKITEEITHLNLPKYDRMTSEEIAQEAEEVKDKSEQESAEPKEQGNKRRIHTGKCVRTEAEERVDHPGKPRVWYNPIKGLCSQGECLQISTRFFKAMTKPVTVKLFKLQYTNEDKPLRVFLKWTCSSCAVLALSLSSYTTLEENPDSENSIVLLAAKKDCEEIGDQKMGELFPSSRPLVKATKTAEPGFANGYANTCTFEIPSETLTDVAAGSDFLVLSALLNVRKPELMYANALHLEASIGTLILQYQQVKPKGSTSDFDTKSLIRNVRCLLVTGDSPLSYEQREKIVHHDLFSDADGMHTSEVGDPRVSPRFARFQCKMFCPKPNTLEPVEPSVKEPAVVEVQSSLSSASKSNADPNSFVIDLAGLRSAEPETLPTKSFSSLDLASPLSPNGKGYELLCLKWDAPPTVDHFLICTTDSLGYQCVRGTTAFSSYVLRLDPKAPNDASIEKITIRPVLSLPAMP